MSHLTDEVKGGQSEYEKLRSVLQGKERKLEVTDKENWHFQSEYERLSLRLAEVRA